MEEYKCFKCGKRDNRLSTSGYGICPKCAMGKTITWRC